MKDNFGFKHKAGVFASVSMLPSDYGIGDFGQESFKFIDFLAETGQKVWQILPLNPTAYGDSPYQSPSSFAGNPYFISPHILYKKGLLSREELINARRKAGRIDYGDLFQKRTDLLFKAYKKFKKVGLYVDYCAKNADWLDDYALFSAIKEKFNYAPWSEWSDEYKFYVKAKARADEFKEKTDFYKFVQFEFESEWKEVLAYAHEKGIVVLGDMPIYVSFDSVDVWARPDEFLLDKKLKPVLVAGCPPDGFSEDGQLWGNPIYNYDKMAKNGFSWWIKRANRLKDLYDIVRIDHFRGFAGYYAVPYGDKTARNGKWYKGVGYPLFEAISKAVPSLKVIAEDLGFITPDVKDLLKKTGYPGMKMLQFAFYDADTHFLPENYTSDNCVVYVGTHDSDATKDWIKNMERKTREKFCRKVPIKKGQNKVDALILFAHKSIANLSMVPIIDYMHLGNEARMNLPATTGDNWRFRLNKNYRTKALKNRMLALTKEGNRL